MKTAASAHRCRHALAFYALSAHRARVEDPGKHEDDGLPYVRERTSRTTHMRTGSPTCEAAGAAIGCSMASTVLPYCPSSLLPHPALLDVHIYVCAHRKYIRSPASHAATTPIYLRAPYTADAKHIGGVAQPAPCRMEAMARPRWVCAAQTR